MPPSTDVHTSVHLKVLDLALARYTPLATCFAIEPSIGLRGVLLREHVKLFNFDAEYFIGQNDRELIGTVDDTTRLSNNFRAIGLRGALGSEWDLGCGWSIFGTGGISLLYGKTKANIDEEMIGSFDFFGPIINVLDDPIPIDQTYTARNSKLSVRPAFDLKVGLAWETDCWCDTRAKLYVAYELNDYLNQIDLKQYATMGNGQNNRGSAFVLKDPTDVSFQGLDVGLMITF